MEIEKLFTRLTCIGYGVAGLLYMAYVINPVENIMVSSLLVALVTFLAMVIANNKGKWYIFMVTPFSYAVAISVALLCANFYMFSVSEITIPSIALFRYVYAGVGYLLAIIATLMTR